MMNFWDTIEGDCDGLCCSQWLLFFDLTDTLCCLGRWFYLEERQGVWYQTRTVSAGQRCIPHPSHASGEEAVRNDVVEHRAARSCDSSPLQRQLVQVSLSEDHVQVVDGTVVQAGQMGTDNACFVLATGGWGIPLHIWSWPRETAWHYTEKYQCQGV